MSLTPSTNSRRSFTDISENQHKAIDRAYNFDRTILIAGKGFGKTVVGQTVAQELITDHVLDRVLVVAPPKVARLSWLPEYEQWEHLWIPGDATGSPVERAAVVRSGSPLVVISADSLKWLFETFGHDHGFDGIILDELTRYKSASAKAVWAMRRHFKDFKWSLGMSATPVLESPLDIYAQALVIDGGKALGTNQDNFRRRYFMPTDFQQYNWVFQPGGEARLAQDLRGLIYVADDTGYEESLPPLRDQFVQCAMAPDAWLDYSEMARTLMLETEDGEVEAANSAVLSGKLGQICSGFLYLDEDRNWRELHRSKLVMLERLLKMREGPTLVSYWYDADRERIEHLLDKMGLKSMTLTGSGKKARADVMWNSGNLDVLLVHPRSAGHGLNLQHGGHELIQFGPIWSADATNQLVGRLRRRGQSAPEVVRKIIYVPETVEELMLARVDGKELKSGALMDHIAQWADE